jgi:hypothetical protein
MFHPPATLARRLHSMVKKHQPSNEVQREMKGSFGAAAGFLPAQSVRQMCKVPG